VRSAGEDLELRPLDRRVQPLGVRPRPTADRLPSRAWRRTSGPRQRA
jgi:hypothetical protein